MQTYYAILGVILLLVGLVYVGQMYRQYRRRLRLRRGFDPALLTDVVRTLEGLS